MNTFFEILAWMATAITIIVFLPQSIKVIRTKDVRTLSKISFPVISLGACLWIIYGASMDQWEVSAANAAVGVLMMPIIYYLFKNNNWIRISLWTMILASIAMMIVFAFVSISRSLEMQYIFVIVAGICAAFGFAPQAYKVFKDKKLESFSVWTGLLIFLCDALWVVYFGHLLESSKGHDIALNSISLSVSFFSSAIQIPILVIYIIDKRKQKTPAH